VPKTTPWPVSARVELGEAEVEDFDPSIAREHHVSRFQVAVDDAPFVRRRQRVGERHGDFEEPAGRKAARRNDQIQGLSLDELHREQPHSAHFLDRENCDDIGMIDRRERLRLAFESRQAFGIRRHGIRQDLDRDLAAELYVARLVHLSHPARAERGEDLVGPQP
jgi:hypothetical protein